MAAGTIQSSLYATGQQQPSVSPNATRHVYGSVIIPANTSFATTDILKLFQFSGPATFLQGFVLDLPAMDAGNGLTMSMVDTLASPTTFFTGNTTGRAAGWITTTAATHGTLLSNSNGGAGYVAGTEIRLVPSAASTNTTGAAALVIYFGFTLFNN